MDVVVRNADGARPGAPQEIGPELVATIRAVPGVAAAAGVVVGEKLQMVGRDGQPIRQRRAVNLVVSWPADRALASGYTLRQGRPPSGSGEVVLDAATAVTGRWRLGDTLGIVGADGGVHRFRVVGVTGFAGRASPASELDSFETPTVAVLQTATAQRLLGRGGAIDEVDLHTAPGVRPEALRDRVARVLPPGRLEAVTAADLAARQADQVQGYVDGLGTVLLVFAAVALLVGGFIIWNTFAVLVASRTREVALLRLLGATRRQVLGSVLGEATGVGLVAAVGGVAAGAGAAVGLRAPAARPGRHAPARRAGAGAPDRAGGARGRRAGHHGRRAGPGAARQPGRAAAGDPRGRLVADEARQPDADRGRARHGRARRRRSHGRAGPARQEHGRGGASARLRCWSA